MIYKKAIQRWGEQSQLIKLNEELSELIGAVSKYLLKDIEKRHEVQILEMHITDEVADCEIMIEQLKRILNLHRKVEQTKIYKLERLEKLCSS